MAAMKRYKNWGSAVSSADMKKLGNPGSEGTAEFARTTGSMPGENRWRKVKRKRCSGLESEVKPIISILLKLYYC
ncbi:MAG: hypothetical protein WCP55_12450 [Lentisphaerota bacterium]